LHPKYTQDIFPNHFFCMQTKCLRIHGPDIISIPLEQCSSFTICKFDSIGSFSHLETRWFLKYYYCTVRVRIWKLESDYLPSNPCLLSSHSYKFNFFWFCQFLPSSRKNKANIIYYSVLVTLIISLAKLPFIWKFHFEKRKRFQCMTLYYGLGNSRKRKHNRWICAAICSSVK